MKDSQLFRNLRERRKSLLDYLAGSRGYIAELQDSITQEKERIKRTESEIAEIEALFVGQGLTVEGEGREEAARPDDGAVEDNT